MSSFVRQNKYSNLKKIKYFIISFVFFITLSNTTQASHNIIFDNEYSTHSLSPLNPISINSSSTAILQFSVEAETGARKIEQISIEFSGTGFVSSDLNALAADNTSGVAIYEESADTPNGFDANDSIVDIHSESEWFGTKAILYLDKFINIPSKKEKTVYVVIKTSSTDSNGHQIIATIPVNGILFSDEENGPSTSWTSEVLTIDTEGPSIVSVEATNPRSIFVKFSEIVDETSAINKDNYTLSDNIGIIQVNKQSDNIYKIVSAEDIEIDSTTLTVSANIFDLVGNRSELASSTITNLMMVKISEFSTHLNDARAEFVELYNSGSDTININGWSVQYREDNFSNWSSVATISSDTSIEPFAFYLFTSPFYALSVAGDSSMLSGLSSLGGHLRLYDGEKEIDYIVWGEAISLSGAISANAHGANESLERKAFGDSSLANMSSGGMDENMGNGWDSDDYSFDFLKQPNPNPQSSSSNAEQPNFVGYRGVAGGGPIINHMPIINAPTGNKLGVFAQFGDPQTSFDNLAAELHYSVGDGTGKITHSDTNYYHLIGAHHSNGYFKFDIPQNHLDSANALANGIYYYLYSVANTGFSKLSASTNPNYESASQNPLIMNVEDSSNWNPHNITGVVINENSDPLKDVLVFLEGSGLSTTTDSLGNYSLMDAKDGIYNLVITKKGYYEENILDIFVNGADIDLGTTTLISGTGGGMTGNNIKPIILWTAPVDEMTGVAPLDENLKILVSFSKDIDVNTFNASSVILSSDASDPKNNPLTGYSVSYDNNSLDNNATDLPEDEYLGIITVPTGGLSADTKYYLIFKDEIRDTAGNSLYGNDSIGDHVISFFTGSDFSSESNWTNFGSGVTQPPTVISTIPTNESFVAPNTKINIKFSVPMEKLSVTNQSNIKLYKITISNNQKIKTSININSNLDKSKQIVIVTPSSNLSAGKYELAITGALKSANKIWLGSPVKNQNNSNYEAFKTSFIIKNNAINDEITPSVIGSWPQDNESNVLINPGIFTIQFSEGIDPTSINKETITLKRGSSKATGDVTYDSMGHSASFVPNIVLMSGAQYIFTVKSGSNGVKDMAGNALSQDYNVKFTTESTQDTLAPSILFAAGDDYNIAITFSESMNAAKITDKANWPSSVLNPDNLIIKWGEANNVSSAGEIIDLESIKANLKYSGTTNTLIIEDLGLDSETTASKEFYIDMTASNVGGVGVSDFSGNTISSTTIFRLPIFSSATTGGGSATIF